MPLSETKTGVLGRVIPLQQLGTALQSLVRENDVFRCFLELFHPIKPTD